MPIERLIEYAPEYEYLILEPNDYLIKTFGILISYSFLCRTVSSKERAIRINVLK
jgi:hypothetical protein